MVLAHAVALLIGAAAIPEVLDAFDPNGDLRITQEEFVRGTVTLYKSWKQLNRAWLGSSTISRAVSLSSYAAMCAALLVTFMLTFNLSPTETILPLSTVLVAVAFAIGGVISDAVRACVACLLWCACPGA